MYNYIILQLVKGTQRFNYLLVILIQAEAKENRLLKKMYYDKYTKLIQTPLKKGDNIFEKISEIDLIVMDIEDIEGSKYVALLGMKETLKKTITLIIEFIPHHLKYVSSTSINEYLELITQYFNYLYIPSQKIYLDNYEQIKKKLEHMYYNNINDNGIIFYKKKIKYKDITSIILNHIILQLKSFLYNKNLKIYHEKQII